MEGITACSVGGRFAVRFPSTSRRNRSLAHRRLPRFLVLASGEGSELDKWDQIELKFGSLLGEDPKLTLAKIMARKANPDVSYLEVEKSFAKDKGKLDESMFTIFTDVNVERRPSDLPREKGLNLTRPIMNKGAKAAAELNLNLSRPVMNKGVKAPDELNLLRPDMNRGLKATRPAEQNRLPRDVDQKSFTAPPNVALRKPEVVREDDVPDKPSKLRIKPNLFLKMRKDDNKDVSDVTLLQRPEVIQKPLNPDQENVSGSSEVKALNDAVKPLSPSEMLRDKPANSISDCCRII